MCFRTARCLDLDISADGTARVVLAGGSGLDPLRHADDAGARDAHANVCSRATRPLSHQFEFGSAVPEGFVFSDDARYLYGSSYYTGVSNIYRYEIATAKLDALSNAEAGYFRPLPLDDATTPDLPLHGAGFRAGDHRDASHRRPERHYFPGRTNRDGASGRAGAGARARPPPCTTKHKSCAAATTNHFANSHANRSIR